CSRIYSLMCSYDSSCLNASCYLHLRVMWLVPPPFLYLFVFVLCLYRGSLLLRGSCNLPLFICVRQCSSVVGVHQCWSVAASLVFVSLLSTSFSAEYWTMPNTASGLAIFVSGRYDSGVGHCPVFCKKGG